MKYGWDGRDLAFITVGFDQDGGVSGWIIDPYCQLTG
jgi:hypothetical protein